MWLRRRIAACFPTLLFFPSSSSSRKRRKDFGY
jgi:hypothetical protein